MSLNVKKLEKVVRLDDGVIRARCPACAERGQDQTGDHLRINADGRFGCCVFPGDSEHRRRIFALAGERSREGIKVRVAAKVSGVVHANILGRLGATFAKASAAKRGSDASDGVGEVQSTNLETRTPRTGVSNSNGGSAEALCLPLMDSRTLRTPLSYSHAEGEKEDREEIKGTYKLKDCAEGVRGVRAQNGENDSGNGMSAVGHAEYGGISEEDLERKMNESPY